MSVCRKFSDLLKYFNPFSANLLTPPPKDEDQDIPPQKRPRLEASIATAADVGADVGAGADIAAQTTDTLTTALPSCIVDVVPKDVVTASSPLQSTGNAEEDAKLTADAVKKHGNNLVIVATLVPGRKKVWCRERWLHVAPTMKGRVPKNG
jgi:hypothetical protein